jgi:hypothetical protein
VKRWHSLCVQLSAAALPARHASTRIRRTYICKFAGKRQCAVQLMRLHRWICHVCNPAGTVPDLPCAAPANLNGGKLINSKSNLLGTAKLWNPHCSKPYSNSITFFLFTFYNNFGKSYFLHF